MRAHRVEENEVCSWYSVSIFRLRDFVSLAKVNYRSTDGGDDDENVSSGTIETSHSYTSYIIVHRKHITTRVKNFEKAGDRLREET